MPIILHPEPPKETDLQRERRKLKMMDNLADRIAAGIILAGAILIGWFWFWPRRLYSRTMYVIVPVSLLLAFLVGFAMGDKYLSRLRWWD
jgi:hypothetical protein